MSETDNALIDAARGRDPAPANQVPWRFIEFNINRAFRGAAAARVEVDTDGAWLWMTPKDIRANIRDHGDHPELRKALAEYKGMQ